MHCDDTCLTLASPPLRPGLTSDWADKLHDQLFVSEHTQSTHEHYLQVGWKLVRGRGLGTGQYYARLRRQAKVVLRPMKGCDEHDRQLSLLGSGYAWVDHVAGYWMVGFGLLAAPVSGSCTGYWCTGLTHACPAPPLTPQVVLTTIEPRHSRHAGTYDAYEYTAHSHTYQADSIPAAKFTYDLSPIQILVQEKSRPWWVLALRWRALRPCSPSLHSIHGYTLYARVDHRPNVPWCTLSCQ